MTPLQQLYHDLYTLRCRFEADADKFYYNLTDNLLKLVDKLMEETNTDPYWERITDIAKKQRAKGLATYGMGIEQNNADMNTRIEMAEEEITDIIYYLEWIKDRLKRMENDNK